VNSRASSGAAGRNACQPTSTSGQPRSSEPVPSRARTGWDGLVVRPAVVLQFRRRVQQLPAFDRVLGFWWKKLVVADDDAVTEQFQRLDPPTVESRRRPRKNGTELPGREWHLRLRRGLAPVSGDERLALERVPRPRALERQRTDGRHRRQRLLVALEAGAVPVVGVARPDRLEQGFEELNGLRFDPGVVRTLLPRPEPSDAGVFRLPGQRTGSSASRRTRPRPIPSIASALTALAWIYPELSTASAGTPHSPSASTSRPCSSPHQRRAYRPRCDPRRARGTS
jgi:hypothetical protein